MSTTSIGSGPSRGGNENHDGDPRTTTLGEKAPGQADPAGRETACGAPEVPGARERPGIAKGVASPPGRPNEEASPSELQAARGRLPKP